MNCIMERRGSVARKPYNLILLKSESATDSEVKTKVTS